MNMELLAEKYWGSFGPAAMPGLSQTNSDTDLGEATAAGLRDSAVPRPMPIDIPANVNYGRGIDFPDATRTVDIGTRKTRQVRRQPRWIQIFSHIMRDETGKGITMMMRIDAVRFLSKIPVGIAMPAVEFGTEEITFEWRHQDRAVTASVEGDGLVGYALKRAERFVSGEGPEDLSVTALPADLLEYLKSFPTE